MLRRLFSIGTIVVLATVFTAASAAKKPPPKTNKKAATYEFLAGANSTAGGPQICTFPAPNPCPDIARAASGDTVAITGTGMLTVHPKSVTGTGTFSSTNTSVGSGTWSAVRLLSFKAFGTNPSIAPGATAGKALIRVQLSNGKMGVLRITCALPGTKFPHSFHEGVRLAIQGGPNFNKEAGGITLFVKQ